MRARDNPFATDRIERLLTFRPEWMDTSWNNIQHRWQSLDQRAALTGRHGAGKTTFMDAWKTRLTERGHQVVSLFLNREKPTFTTQSWEAVEHCAGKIILLDGEEQLGWRARKKFHQLSQGADGLLVSRHSIGKLPVLLHFDPSIEILENCVKKLAPDHYDQLSPELEAWWQLCNGNIREVLLRCYDEVNRINQ